MVSWTLGPSRDGRDDMVGLNEWVGVGIGVDVDVDERIKWVEV